MCYKYWDINFYQEILLLDFKFIWAWGIIEGFPGGSDGKESVCNAGGLGLIPGSGRSPREVNDCPLQYSCLEDSWTEGPGGLQSMGSQRVGHD